MVNSGDKKGRFPFYIEKKRKIIKGLKGVEELRKSDFRDVEATMKNGGGSIMAMGRARGERRVEHAIQNALDSPLLYGNDIGRAKRILFNIYSSDEHPIFVQEMLQIDDFFDQLDPNIDVIWGTATDDSLGEDAKVTILATGLEDELRREVQQDAHQNEDDYYEDLIPLLYKPAKQKKVVEVLTQELPFEVEPAPDPEPAEPEPMPPPVPEEPRTPTIIDKLRNYLLNLVKDDGDY